MVGGGGGRRWWRPEVVAVTGDRWPVAVVAGEEGRKEYIGNKRLVPLSSTYFDVKHGTGCSCSCLFHPVAVPNATSKNRPVTD